MSARPTPADFRSYRPADRHWVATANIRHYGTVDGFDPSFAGAVADALDLLEAQRREAGIHYLIVEAGAQRRPVGCLFLSAEGPALGRLRLVYLDAAYRGLGIGRDMVGRAIAHARRQGVERIRVSTFDRHGAACRLYRSMGFREVAREPVTAFGQRMRRIEFEKGL